MGGWLLGVRIVGALLGRAADWARALRLALRGRRALAAETLLLRWQLALLVERGARPRRLSPTERLHLAWLAGWTPRWRRALVVVRPETLVRWQRQGFRLLWRLRSRATGRPAVPAELRRLIAEMVAANPCWGEERVAAELLVMLGVRVSPRTVRRYWPRERPAGRGDQRWSTFVRNHAQALVACDFFTAVTAMFRVVYVLVVMEVGSRRILHVNVTSHPTADWTAQQLRQAIPFDHAYRFLIHDRDSIYSAAVDATIRSFGVRVVRTPVRAP